MSGLRAGQPDDSHRCRLRRQCCAAPILHQTPAQKIAATLDIISGRSVVSGNPKMTKPGGPMQRFSFLCVTVISKTGGRNKMVQSSEVFTREANRISVASARRTITREDYLAVAERAIPVNAIEQTWIFEAGQKARVGTAPRFLNHLVKIVNWLSHVSSGKIDDGRLESRHNIHHNFRINGIGL